MKNISALLAVLSVLLPAASSAADAPAAPGYHVAKKISLPGDSGWDYLALDELSRRLYVTHGDQVQALDADTGELKGAVTGLKGVHGVALAGGKGFISDGKDGAVDVFDPQTMKAVKEIKAGKNPDAIIYDEASGKVFAFNGGSSDASVIDPAKEKVVKTIPLGGKPEFAAADGKGFIYDNLEDKGELVKIDSKKLKVAARWKLAGCEEPSALAIDAAHGRLFAGCGNKVMAVVDAGSGKVLAALPIGEHVDAASFDPGTGLIFMSCADATVTVVRQETPDRYSVAETVKTQPWAKTNALDAKTHKLFLSTAEFGPAPEPKPGEHRKRPPVLPGTFTVLVLDR